LVVLPAVFSTISAVVQTNPQTPKFNLERASKVKKERQEDLTFRIPVAYVYLRHQG
jgi:hypothetical protein